MFGFFFSGFIGQQGTKIRCTKTQTLPNFTLPIRSGNFSINVIWQNFSDWESGEGHEHGDTEQSLSLHCLWLAHHYQWFLAEPSGKLWQTWVVIVFSCKNYLPSYRTTVTIYQLPLELNHGMAHAPTIPAHWPRCSWTRAEPGDKYRASSCLCQVCGRV